MIAAATAATSAREMWYCLYLHLLGSRNGIRMTGIKIQNTRGGQLGKCPNMCPFCTRKPVIHCPFIRLIPLLLFFDFGIMT
jgi:hypothetical protein